MQSNHSESDIFIIGGGINGAGIAVDAAGRGLSVTLCEKNDLASGTSSASSKLIHGGLRYLESYDFSLVRKALQEREILMRKAPHLIYPLEFVLPHSKQLRPSWLIRLGLFLYDHLAAHPGLPNSKKITLADDPRGKNLKPEYTIGFTYYDCYDDDARLVVTNAIAAKELGATILTNTTCVSAHYENQRWKIITSDTKGQQTHYAKVLVNASGPWIVKNQDLISPQKTVSVELIKGSHIVVPKLYEGNFAYILQNPDKRVVFAIPYENDFTMIGTTDVPYNEDLDDVEISDEEKNYLFDTIQRYFSKNLANENIIFSWAGVRCLQEDNKSKASDLSRDYKVEFNQTDALLTVISGKITTYRRLAAEAVDQLSALFPNMKPSWTETKPLPGGDMPDHDFQKFFANAKQQYRWLPEELCYRYAKSYGTRMHVLLKNAESITDLGSEILPNLNEREINYLIEHEWAKTPDDILWRRTKLGLFSSAVDVSNLRAYLAKTLPHE